MVQFICLFFPAIVSLGIFEAISKRTEKVKASIFRFALNTIIINFGVFAVKMYISDTASNPLTYGFNDMTPESALFFMVIAVPLAVITGLIKSLIIKNVETSVGQDNNEAEK